LKGAEAVREVRPVLQHTEVALGIGVVVGHVRAAVRLRNWYRARRSLP
jgi:hypothetical protein